MATSVDEAFLEAPINAAPSEWWDDDPIETSLFFTDKEDEIVEVHAKRPTLRDWIRGRFGHLPDVVVERRSLFDLTFGNKNSDERLTTRSWLMTPPRGGPSIDAEALTGTVDAFKILRERESGPSSPWLLEQLKNLPERQTITITLPRDRQLTYTQKRELERLVAKIVSGGYVPGTKKLKVSVGE